MTADSGMAGPWPEMARVWPQIGPPLRPVSEDIGFCRAAVADWVRCHGAPRVLLLGVTPELYRLPWPKGTGLLAVDRAQAMIDRVWPGPAEAVRCADWLSISLPRASRDIVLCDGGLHLVSYPEGQGRLVRILRDILAADGLCILRLYVPPAQRETPDAVLRDLLDGKVSSLNILKLRLGMSLMEEASRGVRLGTVWQTLHQAAPDLAALAARIGWTPEHALAINTYRESEARYSFASVREVCGLFCRAPGGFRLQGVNTPSYELGERCPTVVLQRSDLGPRA